MNVIVQFGKILMYGKFMLDHVKLILVLLLAISGGILGSLFYDYATPAPMSRPNQDLNALNQAVFICQFDSITGERFCLSHSQLIAARLIQDENQLSEALSNHEQRLLNIENYLMVKEGGDQIEN